MSKLVKTSEQQTSNIMEKLPQEIILGILSRLPSTSLLQSMLVCRAWRRLIRDPLLVATHFSHMADKDGPSFIFQSNRPSSSYQLFFIDFSDFHSQGKVMFKKLPHLMSIYLLDSCNGLLCMRDARWIYICNPFTRVYLQLPKLVNYPAQVGHIAFGFHQTTKQYKVIQVVYLRQQVLLGGRINVATSTLVQSQVHVLTIGDPSWRHIGTLPYDLARPIPKALVNGRLHWLSKPNNDNTASIFISFDLETEQFQEMAKPDCCGSNRCFHHLMVLRGFLSAGAYHDNDELEVWVMKEYGIKESWIKEFTIGNHLPPTLQQNDLLHFNMAKARFPNSSVRVLCILRNDEILLEYLNRVVVVFDPRHGTFKELTFDAMPHWYKLVVHVGSLNWIHIPVCGVIRDGKGNWVLGYNRFLGKCLVVVAEFWGILDGLLLLQEQGYDEVTIHSDNLEIIISISNSILEELSFNLIRRIQQILAKEEKRSLRYILREANRIANALAKMTLPNDEVLHMFDDSR
ncbi:F-box protein At3g07870-like [Gossypium arboreum]|uniref:F-box protein At3g07870-like n=1 Tax=Gossypium arboreum TaxID=29729 RepID=UPI0022F184E0|nr:F-box protein At3g07870-like [Gossypium arboreum]